MAKTKEMEMLVNPRGRRRRATTKRKRRAAPVRNAAPRRRRRKRAAAKNPAPRRKATRRRRNPTVPQWMKDRGFSSYAAWFAHIRKGGTVAKRRRRSTKRRASNPPRRRRRRNPVARASNPPRRRRRRRNPFGIAVPGGIVGTAVKVATAGVIDAAEATVGMVGARFLRGKANLEGNTIPGALAETMVGIVGGVLARRKFPNFAKMFAAGAIMGPLQSAVKSANIPIISPALGDEGELPLIGGLYDLGTYDMALGSGDTLGSELGAYENEPAAYV